MCARARVCVRERYEIKLWSINSLRAELTWSRATHAGFACVLSLVQTDGLQAPFPAERCTSDLNPEYAHTWNRSSQHQSVFFLLLSLQDGTSGACKIIIPRPPPCLLRKTASWNLCRSHIPGAVVSPILYLHSTRG